MSRRLERLDAQQVAMRERRRVTAAACRFAARASARFGAAAAPARRSTTRSSPSSSFSRTCTTSSRVRGEGLARVVGVDGQLAVAAVHEHGQLDARGPAEVDQLVEGGAHGAAGEEHVVHQHHRAAVDRRSGCRCPS